MRRIHHVGIVVKRREEAYAFYRDVLGLSLVREAEIVDQGVRAALLAAGDSEVELLEPLGAGSPIAKFLERNADGGIHHLCYEVDDIIAARDRLKAAGARVLGDGEPKIGAHGKPVLFLHPKDFCGTLVELEQA